MIAAVLAVMLASICPTSMQDRDGANLQYGLGGREEGVRGHDDLVSHADLQGSERNHQRIRPRGDTDCVPDAQVIGHLLFEGINVRPKDELTRFENVGDRVVYLLAQRDILRLEIEQRNSLNNLARRHQELTFWGNMGFVRYHSRTYPEWRTCRLPVP
jgi:hypothetical protein